MSSLESVSVTVPCIDGELIDINPGDIWPLPFRGSRYTLKAKASRVKFYWTHMDKEYSADSIPRGLIKAFWEYKHDTRGSIRITPHGEVITKVYPSWKPVYLGKMVGDLDFNGFELNPTTFDVGRTWKGFHFKHGETFAVWSREGSRSYLYWSKQGIYYRTINEHPDLVAKVKEIRPKCGRLYITETGHIWMNLPANEISPDWVQKINGFLEEDKMLIGDPAYDVVFRSIKDRVANTLCWPIHIGHVSQYDDGEAPRTHFKTTKHFGLGGEDIDDEDGYDADSWKRMKRDY